MIFFVHVICLAFLEKRTGQTDSVDEHDVDDVDGVMIFTVKCIA